MLQNIHVDEHSSKNNIVIIHEILQLNVFYLKSIKWHKVGWFKI